MKQQILTIPVVKIGSLKVGNIKIEKDIAYVKYDISYKNISKEQGEEVIKTAMSRVKGHDKLTVKVSEDKSHLMLTISTLQSNHYQKIAKDYISALSNQIRQMRRNDEY